MPTVEEDDEDVPDAVSDGEGFVVGGGKAGELEAWGVDVIGGSVIGGSGVEEVGGNSSNLAYKCLLALRQFITKNILISEVIES